MLWNLVESSEIVLFCIVFYGRPSGWSDTSGGGGAYLNSHGAHFFSEFSVWHKIVFGISLIIKLCLFAINHFVAIALIMKSCFIGHGLFFQLFKASLD